MCWKVSAAAAAPDAASRQCEFIPAEVLRRPSSLVGFFGFDLHTNALHKTIHEAFVAKRQPDDKFPITYRLIEPTHSFPQPKAKVQIRWKIFPIRMVRDAMEMHLH